MHSQVIAHGRQMEHACQCGTCSAYWQLRPYVARLSYMSYLPNIHYQTTQTEKSTQAQKSTRINATTHTTQGILPLVLLLRTEESTRQAMTFRL